MNNAEWSGSPWPQDPDNVWVDDDTRELVCAHTQFRAPLEAANWKRADVASFFARKKQGLPDRHISPGET